MQTRDERLAADARLQPFAGRAGFLVAGISTAAALCFAGLVITISFLLTAQPDIMAMSIDFRVFWGASKLALAGEPLAAHDLARLGATHAAYPDAYMPWLYPPGYLLLITPLGTMSFSVAYLVWTVLSYAALALALRPFAGGYWQVWLILVVAPAYYPSVLLGQNGMFWMAGLLAALAALRSERWILAGVFIGCLTLKPQLGLMIPVALLAIGAWRTILSATVTAVTLIVVPTLFYGVEYWTLLRAGLAEHSANMIHSFPNIELMVSPLYTLSFFGVGRDLAMNIQLAIIALMVAVVFAFWRSSRVGFDLKAAVLVIAVLLTAPYMWYYEAGLLVAVALFLLRAGVLNLRFPLLVVAALFWIGCGPQALNVLGEVIDPRWLGAAFVSPLLFVCLGLCLRHLLQRPAPSPALT